MTRTASLLMLLLASTALITARASAQPIDVRPLAPVRTETLRLALGIGVSAVGGTDVENNGRSVAGDYPAMLPMPSLNARADFPIHSHLLVGVQSALFYWAVTSGRDLFGDTGHTTIDLGAIARLRFAFGGTKFGHEILGSVVVGPTFDIYDPSPRSYGASFENEVGWHTGLLGGYQLIRRDGWGMFADVGFTWHYIPETYEYQLESDRRATEEMIYRPVEVFLRAGFLLLPF